MADRRAQIPRHVACMRIVVSLLILLVGLAILTAPNVVFADKFDDATQKIAAGWIGAVLGYWLS